jgi:hypothetical protein
MKLSIALASTVLVLSTPVFSQEKPAPAAPAAPAPSTVKIIEVTPDQE